MTGYRYALTRSAADYGLHVRDAPDRPLVWIMLNPSTADETTDDPTLRRVCGFTFTAGWSSLVVVNLFAKRCTRPVHLLDDDDDPVGSENGQTLWSTLSQAHDVVCAWGAFVAQPRARQLQEQRPNVEHMIHRAGANAWCLGTTSGGYPRHPLYVSGQTLFERYPTYAGAPGTPVVDRER